MPCAKCYAIFEKINLPWWRKLLLKQKAKNSVPSLTPAASQVGPESRRSSRLEGAPRPGHPPRLAGWGLLTHQWTWMRTQSRLLREPHSPGTKGDRLNWGTRYERGMISQNHSSSSLPDDWGNPWDNEAIQWRDKLVNPTYGSHLTSNLHWISLTSSLPSSHHYLSLMWLRWDIVHVYQVKTLSLTQS